MSDVTSGSQEKEVEKSSTGPQIDFQTSNHSDLVLSLLKRDTKYCDVLIKAEGKQFKVHKNLFGIYSDFFDKAFNLEMKEKYERVVKLEGVKAEVAETLVNFFYTGSIALTNENAFECLVAADYLMISQIVKYVTQFLRDSINVESCLKIWDYGKKFNIDSLIERSEAFFGQNLGAVTKKGSLGSLDAEDIVKLLEISKQQKATMEEIYLAIVTWIKSDLNVRRSLFNELFPNVDLRLLSNDFLKTIALNENLIRSSVDLANIVVSELVSRVDKAADEKHAASNRPFTKEYFLVVTENGHVHQYEEKTGKISMLPNTTLIQQHVTIGRNQFRVYQHKIEKRVPGTQDWLVIKNLEMGANPYRHRVEPTIFELNDRLHLVEQQQCMKVLQEYSVNENKWTEVGRFNIEDQIEQCMEELPEYSVNENKWTEVGRFNIEDQIKKVIPIH